MALRKPAVINTEGHIEQLQPGDTLAAPIAGGNIVQATNGEASSVTVGQVVYLSAADTVKLAQANAIGTVIAIGLIGDPSIAASAVGGVQTDGILSTPDWTSVVGATLLTPATEYFLDPDNPGTMVIVPPQPTDIGEFVVSLGVAFSTTDFRIEIHPYIKL